MAKFKFELGIVAEDKVSNLKGVITSRCDHITGCNRYGIQPPAEKGVLPNQVWFDEGRVKKVPDVKKITKKSVAAKTPGACGVPQSTSCCG